MITVAQRPVVLRAVHNGPQRAATRFKEACQ